MTAPELPPGAIVLVTKAGEPAPAWLLADWRRLRERMASGLVIPAAEFERRRERAAQQAAAAAEQRERERQEAAAAEREAAIEAGVEQAERGRLARMRAKVAEAIDGRAAAGG